MGDKPYDDTGMELDETYNILTSIKNTLKEARNKKVQEMIITADPDMPTGRHKDVKRKKSKKSMKKPVKAMPETLSEAKKRAIEKHIKEIEKEIAGYDYKDKVNNNNLSTPQILAGYYAEMKDPKNASKTEEEIKQVVFKNLQKDPLYYVKDGQHLKQF